MPYAFVLFPRPKRGPCRVRVHDFGMPQSCPNIRRTGPGIKSGGSRSLSLLAPDAAKYALLQRLPDAALRDTHATRTILMG